MNHHIARNGQQVGVFTEAEVQSGFASGRFLADDLYWTEGMAEWLPLHTRFSTAPPTPAIASAATHTLDPFNPYAAPQANIVIRAPQSDLVLASRGSRLGASILDPLIFGIVAAIFIGTGAALENSEKTSETTGSDMASGIFYLIGFISIVGLMIYNVVLLSTRGQTLGKKWLGIRIVTHPEGHNPGFVKAVLLRTIVNGILANFLPAIYQIVDACFIFREDQRCLHDLIADTTVIKERTDS